MNSRTKFRDLIIAGDTGGHGGARTALVPRLPFEPESNSGHSANGEDYRGLGSLAEPGLVVGDHDANREGDRADTLTSALFADGAASDGARSKSGDLGHIPHQGVKPEEIKGHADPSVQATQTVKAGDVGENGVADQVVAGTIGHSGAAYPIPSTSQSFDHQNVQSLAGSESEGTSPTGFVGMGTKALGQIDIDVAVYSPVTISIVVDPATGSRASGELFHVDSSVRTNFLEQGNFNVSDHEATSASVANSGGNSVFGGLVAINAGNPAVSIALAVNNAPITQSNTAETSKPWDSGLPSITAFGDSLAEKSQSHFSSLTMNNLSISDHHASALSLANSGDNTVIGGILAINAGNPAVSEAVSINIAPITEVNTAHIVDEDVGMDGLLF